MERTVAQQNVGGATLAALRRGWIAAAAALVAALLLLYVSPSPVFGRGGGSSFGRYGTSSSIPAGSRLDGLKVLVTSPAYAGGRTVTLDDPSAIAGLTGSGIYILGKGSAAGLLASSTTVVSISGVNGGWVALLMMPAKPAALTLKDRNFERTIVLDPRADAPPRITLTSPLRDTTLRTPRLVVNLNVTVSDDIGLDDGHFEYLITTGSGEIFKARTITTPVVHFAGSRISSMSATLDLASLQLVEGDIVSMRAIAQDGNTFSGPGVATSDTRTIRIARAGEYDSLAIDAAAPQPIDSSATSQRMLIVMTEQLVREQPKLTRQDLVKRSTEIGDLEERIRRRVHEILTDNPEEIVADKPGDSAATIEQMEAPEEITGAKNPELVTAYNALWQAVRSLQIAEPAPALPPMRVALKALDRARVANRLYLRGVPPKIVVNLDRVRLTGKEKGSSSTRSPRSFADSARVRLSARFAAVLDLIEKQPGRAMTELALMRVEALPTLPDFAAALGEATDAIRGGKMRPSRSSGRAVPWTVRPRQRPDFPHGRAANDRLRTSTPRLSPPASPLPPDFVFCTGQYDSGDWDSAPDLPSNLIDSVARYTSIAVAPSGAIVPLASDAIFEYPLVYLTGHLPFRFSEAERRNVRKLVERGGMLFIDDHNHDIGGVFHKTAIEEIARTFSPPKDLPNDNEIYRCFFKFSDGPPATSHELNGWGDNLVHKNLQAVMQGDRIGVLYSSKDYSSEWNYSPDSKRFSTVDNTRFGVNIIVYALTR